MNLAEDIKIASINTSMAGFVLRHPEFLHSKSLQHELRVHVAEAKEALERAEKAIHDLWRS